MILVLINPRARFAKTRGAAALHSQIERILGSTGVVYQTASLAELEKALKRTSPANTQCVVALGGDGTLSTVLSCAVKVWGNDNLPPFFPVFAGTMNEIAGDVHTRPMKPLAAIEKLVDLARSDQLIRTQRYPLVINGQRYGFAFGFGASSRFLEAYNRAGGGVWQAVKQVGYYVASAIVGGATARKLFEGVKGRLVQDGHTRALNWSMCLILTVRKLPLRVQLSTSGGEQTKPDMCVVGGLARLFWLAVCLPLIWMGRLPKRTGITRSNAKAIDFEFEQPQAWHLDGDLHDASSRLEIRIGPAVRFIRF
ncbi:MAG: diacylglycerol kinase family protein [Limnobacter sp.]|nr:diacylglycerol kinase family protein [Limnobacter sp.]